MGRGPFSIGGEGAVEPSLSQMFSSTTVQPFSIGAIIGAKVGADAVMSAQTGPKGLPDDAEMRSTYSFRSSSMRMPEIS